MPQNVFGPEDGRFHRFDRTTIPERCWLLLTSFSIPIFEKKYYSALYLNEISCNREYLNRLVLKIPVDLLTFGSEKKRKRNEESYLILPLQTKKQISSSSKNLQWIYPFSLYLFLSLSLFLFLSNNKWKQIFKKSKKPKKFYFDIVPKTWKSDFIESQKSVEDTAPSPRLSLSTNTNEQMKEK